MTENIEHYQNQITLARTEIKNLRQQLSSLKHEHLKEIKAIKAALSQLRCSNCADTATAVQSNHYEQLQPPSTSEDGNIVYQPIGVIETSFQNKRAVPRQTSILGQSRGTVVIDTATFNNPEHALSGLEEFSHMWVIFHFHATCSSAAPAKVSPPRLAGARRGVLATRAPHRPCRIGLSLVQIQSIEGNKIKFLGVDMVNGTPVLDIKPYIPQYDHPGQLIASIRPPTEGTSDVNIGNLQIQDDDNESQTSRSPIPMGAATARSPIRDGMPSPEHNQGTPSPESPSTELLDGSPSRPPTRRPDSERGAPDGQERFTPPQSAQLTGTSYDGVRVAPWITDPPAQTYEVKFTDDALARLVELIGDRAPTFKNNITSLLSEDPRSQYVRGRYPDHEYSCVLEDLSISCVFDASSAVCSIVAVRSADDLN